MLPQCRKPNKWLFASVYELPGFVFSFVTLDITCYAVLDLLLLLFAFSAGEWAQKASCCRPCWILKWRRTRKRAGESQPDNEATRANSVSSACWMIIMSRSAVFLCTEEFDIPVVAKLLPHDVWVCTRSHASKGGSLNIHMNLITVSLMCHADSKSSVTRKPWLSTGSQTLSWTLPDEVIYRIASNKKRVLGLTEHAWEASRLQKEVP